MHPSVLLRACLNSSLSATIYHLLWVSLEFFSFLGALVSFHLPHVDSPAPSEQGTSSFLPPGEWVSLPIFEWFLLVFVSFSYFLFFPCRYGVICEGFFDMLFFFPCFIVVKSLQVDLKAHRFYSYIYCPLRWREVRQWLAEQCSEGAIGSVKRTSSPPSLALLHL